MIKQLTEEHLRILRSPKEGEVLVYDIESNHYDFDILHTLHCISVGDYKTGDVKLYVTPAEQKEAVKRLNNAEIVVAHNGIKFDNRAMPMFHKNFKPKMVVDTLILSKLAKPSLFSHKLEVWGKLLKCAKGDYAKEFKERAGTSYKKGDEWLVYSDDMGAYCKQDVVVNLKILKNVMHYVDIVYPWSSAQLEHYIAHRVIEMESVGVGFNVRNGHELENQLVERLDEIYNLLLDDWAGYEVRETFIPKVNRKDLGYVKGVPFTKVKFIEFNPASRQHVERYLREQFDWEPWVFTDSGQAKISDEILEIVAKEIPEAGLIAEYLMLSKRLSQLSSADGSWLKKEKKGRIHGSINTVGTNTFRCSHNNPNLGQVPACGKPYGAECRELFSHGLGDDWLFLGCDMSGIEARLLGSYCAPLDGGALNDIILNGDIHTHNQKMAGLETRAQAKTFFYSLMYGAGDMHIGKQLGGGLAKGKRARDKFMKNMPAFSGLLARMGAYRANKAGNRPKYMKNHVKGLDGRHLFVKNEHTLLNYVLQSAGAILSKEWIRIFDELLEAEGLTSKVKVMLYVHDEIQMAVRKGYEDTVGKLCVRAIELAGEKYKLNIPITGEFDVGENWKDTH